MAIRKPLQILLPFFLTLLLVTLPLSCSQAEDGKITFVANVEGNWDLFLADDDGGNLRQLTHTPFDERFPALSPDRSQIAYSTSDSNLWIVGVDGRDTHRLDLPKGSYNYPTWSPDGQSLIFTSFTFLSLEWEEGDLWRYSLKDRSLDKSLRQSGVQVHPVYLENGDILYSLALSGPLTQIVHQLWRYDAVARRARQLLLTQFNDLQPDVSPDGERIVFASDRSGSYDLWIVDVTGENLDRLTSHPASDMDPVFSPDGRRILFISNRTGFFGLYVIDKETRETKRLSPFNERTAEIRDPDWR